MSHPQGSILHLIDTTGPGGAETIFTQLAAYTQNQGFRSIAAIRGPGWVQRELERLGVETRVINCKGSFNISFLRSLRDIIRTEEIDLIQAHLLGSSLYGSLAGLWTRTTVISTFHGHVDVSPNERLRLLKFLIIQLGSQSIVAVTQKLRDMLIQVPTVSASKVTTIPNGIDTTLYAPGPAAPLRRDYDVPDSTIIVGCLGNVRRAKNYNLALETLKVLDDKGVDARLFIAGDDTNSLAKEHKQYAQELNIQNKIVWLGFYKDTPAFLNAIDVFLLSSSSEGHPLAITQAMAAGVPIVATQCGVEEILKHGETAMLVECGNARQLAENILNVYQSSSLKNQLTEKARLAVKQTFSLDAMFENYITLYRAHMRNNIESTQTPSWLRTQIIKRYGSKRGLANSLKHSTVNLLTGKNKKYRTLPENVGRVVFVCKGNICRSAVAEHAFRKYSMVPTASIGLDTHTGKAGHDPIVHYARSIGIDMTDHLTTAAEDFTPLKNDLFVCMEPGHIESLRRIYGNVNIILLGYFGNPRKIYIHDPYSSPISYAQSCTDYIANSAHALAANFDISAKSS